MRLRPVIAVLVLGLMLAGSVLAGVLAQTLADRRARESQARSVQLKAQELRHSLREAGQVLQSMRSYYGASARVEPGEFAAFADPLRRTAPGLLNLSWMPRVTRDELPGWRRETGLTVRDVQPSGALVDAPVRAVSYPVTYIAPLAENRAVLGLDPTSDPTRREAVAASIARGAVMASPPIELPNGQGRGVVLYLPTGTPGRQDGLLAAAFRLDDLVAPIAGDAGAVSVTEGAETIAGPPARLARGAAAGTTVLGRRWGVRAADTPDAGPIGLAVAGAGIALTLVVALMFLQAARRERYALALVARRLSERDRAEHALADTRALLGTAQDAVMDAILVLRAVRGPAGDIRDFRILSANRVARAMSPGVEVRGRTLLEVSEDPDITSHIARFAEVVEARGHREEEVVLDRGGEPRRFVVQIASHGDRDAAVVVFRDITERHRAEEANRRLAETQRLVLEGTDEGIGGVDREGRVVFLNPAAERLLGVRAERVVGTHMDTMLPARRADGTPYPAEESPLRRALAGAEGGRSADQLVVRADGTTFPGEWAVQPILAEGAALGAVVVFHDITARRELEAMKDDFIAVASHELRTPLTSVVGYLQLALGRQEEVLGTARDLLEVAERNGRRLIDLVEDLLTMAQGDAGRLTLVRAPCDLGRLIAERVELVGPAAAKQRVTLIAEITEPVEAPVDGRRIEQVLDNLLSNALKFTPPGGMVRVGARVDGTDAVLSVRDSGLGIPADERDRIFERFSRAPSAVRDQVPGSGLGLAVCRMIVERHGGRIEVDSEEGAGTTVLVRLPLEPATEGSPGRPEAVGS